MAEAKSEGKDTAGASADTSTSDGTTEQRADGQTESQAEGTRTSNPAGTSEPAGATRAAAASETKAEPTSEPKAEPESGSAAKPTSQADAQPASDPKATKAPARTGTRPASRPEPKGGDKNGDNDGAKSSGRSTKETVASVRKGIASAIWLLSVLAALILAAGALVIALDFNRQNAVVSFFIHTADNINFLGTMKKFDPTGKSPSAVHSALVKTVLVNWGICAVAYLVIGKILDRIIRP